MKLRSGRLLTAPLPPIRQAVAHVVNLPGVSNLTIGDPAISVPQSVRLAGADAFLSGPHSYTPNLGLIELRRLVVKDLETRLGLTYGDDDICITNGGNQAITLAIAATTQPADGILMPSPGYPNFTMAAHFAGNTIETYDCSEDTQWLPTLHTLERAYRDDVSLLILNTPSNPTGAVMNPHQLAEIADWARFRNLWILSDECYWPYSDTGRFSIAQFAPERTYILDSFSKRFGFTGWRIGTLAAPRGEANKLLKGQEATVACISYPAQAAAMAAISDRTGHYEREYERFSAQRNQLVETLNSLGKTPAVGNGGIYAWANFSQVVDTTRNDWHLDLMKTANIAVVPGSAFGENAQQWGRLSAAINENDFALALERVRSI
ncbi:pyridoxal phosphate-dependent aminotransferase [Kocuria salsicia]|uniref:pyridoxal phosphate-dependent aminotransferase n=1 Tax=Kocuria salsicia TaxID=664639 RepID=UPI001643E67B|nr:pyridoxal phosphate-dependent aminotransferase [Kocuria salsicia]